MMKTDPLDRSLLRGYSKTTSNLKQEIMKSTHNASHLSAEAAIFRVDSNWLIQAANTRAEELTGLAASDLAGKPIKDFFCRPEEFSGLLALCDSSGYGNDDINCHPVRLCGKNDRPLQPLLATVLPLSGRHKTGGEVLLCLQEPSDISYIQRLVLNSVADGIFTVDRNWVITSFNRAAEIITGWPAPEAVGKSCSEVFRSSICGKSCAIAESLYSGRPVPNRSITIRRRDGEEIPISISASPLVDNEGNIIGGVETFRDLSVLTSMPKTLNRKYSLDRIFSKSKTMQRLFAVLPEIAASPSNVLIHGESGTGKELIARAIYHISNRRDMPFIALNCGALPESLLESELFGYKAGAFTDARKDKGGRFAAAERGTLFLDEIGDIPKSIQVKLLRVLQEKVYEPLGSNTPVKTDVRIITATNRDLQTLVDTGKFREDLFYRLNVVRIHLLPLRERKEDIPLLTSQFIEEFSAEMGRDIVGISSSALTILMHHDFPGNIRELKNIIEYAFILCDGAYILPEHLPEPFTTGAAYSEPEINSEQERPQTLEEIEKQAIFIALEKNRWKKTATCEELGISKDTLRRKLIKYNLDQPGKEMLNEVE